MAIYRGPPPPPLLKKKNTNITLRCTLQDLLSTSLHARFVHIFEDAILLFILIKTFQLFLSYSPHIAFRAFYHFQEGCIYLTSYPLLWSDSSRHLRLDSPGEKFGVATHCETYLFKNSTFQYVFTRCEQSGTRNYLSPGFAALHYKLQYR